MNIYAGKNFTATAEGQRLLPVTCEKCKTAYRYQLSRLGAGTGHSPYFMFQRAAARRAERAAQRDLARRLESEVELVPCPKCNWVNEDLVLQYRSRRYRTAGHWAFILMLLGLFVGALLHVLPERGEYAVRTAQSTRVAFIVAGLLVPLCVLPIRAALRRRIDPNRSYPGFPTLPAGTPPPLVERVDQDSGETYLEALPIPAEGVQHSGRRFWAILRPAQFILPPVCCICLAEDAAATFRAPFRASDDADAVLVPLCRACARHLHTRWWLLTLMVSAVTIGASAFIAFVATDSDQFGSWMLFVLLALFSTAFAAAIVPGHVCRPYRVRTVDKDRGIFMFSAVNDAYTRLVAKEARTADGIALD